MDVPTQICSIVESTDGAMKPNNDEEAHAGVVTTIPSSTTKKEHTENSSENNSSISNSSNENSEEDQGHLPKEVKELPVFQYPDTGKRRKIGVEDQLDSDIVTIMPHVKEGKIKKEFKDSVIAAHVRVGEEMSDRVQLRVKGYTDYLKWQDYLRRRHEIINRKINEWRKATLDLLEHAKNDWVLGDNYCPWCFFRQRTWAEKIIPNVMLGINNFKTITVDILNIGALICYVDGVDTREEAIFVFQISNCEHFEFCVKPKAMANNFTIETIFDHVYGKTVCSIFHVIK
jgi:hypothetical protein